MTDSLCSFCVRIRLSHHNFYYQISLFFDDLPNLVTALVLVSPHFSATTAFIAQRHAALKTAVMLLPLLQTLQ